MAFLKDFTNQTKKGTVRPCRVPQKIYVLRQTKKALYDKHESFVCSFQVWQIFVFWIRGAWFLAGNQLHELQTHGMWWVV